MYKYIYFLIILSSCSNNKNDLQQIATSNDVGTSTISPTDIIGKTIEYTYGESVYHVIIDTDSTMHWKAVAGDEKGVEENEHYKIEEIGTNQLFITWGEANGIGVSQVLDFNQGKVYNHLLRGRDVSIGQGDIRIIN